MRINGKQLAQEHFHILKEYFSGLISPAYLHIIVVGYNPVIEKFVALKKKRAEEIGIVIQIHRYDEYISQVDLEKECSTIVSRCRMGDGIIVQLPLSPHLDTTTIVSLIPPEHDIDVLNPQTYTHFTNGTTNLVPPVAGAIWHILEHHHLLSSDINIVMVGHGRLVGIPVEDLLRREGIRSHIITATTDPDIRRKLLLAADMIISGAGDPWSIMPDNIKEGVVLIDAGTSESESVIRGDIHPDCYAKASYYTPVPGGVGPLTITMLFENMRRLNQESFMVHY